MDNNPPLERYLERLKTIPPPGSGQCHPDLLGVANLGILAGRSAQELFDDIRRSIPHGQRHVSNREIQDTIDTALRDVGKQPPKEYREPVVRDGKRAMKGILAAAISDDEADLWDLSPIRIDYPPGDGNETALFLETVFRADDKVFIGDALDTGVPGKNIRMTAEWCEHFRNGGSGGPFYIVNPLTGESTPKRDREGVSYRSDANVARYAHALVEFDRMSKADQFRFWMTVKLPVLSLVDSGGKSIHGLLDVSMLADVRSSEEWNSHIKMRLFFERLRPLGVDKACSNPARMSRLPGVRRKETGRWQRLLWLSPNGREVRHE